MLTLGPLAFANPWMLAGLAALPAIWWLLRISPPMPKRVRFPATRLLVGLVHEEETPAHTPFWLLLLRLAIAALAIFALAEPIWNPAPRIAGSGPLLIVTDNGWASATHWNERRTAMDGLIAEAGRADRPVLVVGTAPDANAPELNFETADSANARARALEPQPIEPDRTALAEKLEGAETLARGNVQTVWISDGLDYGAAAQFANRLSALAGSAGLTLIEPATGSRALALLPPEQGSNEFAATVIRAEAGGQRAGSIRATQADGAVLSETPFSFEDGAKRTKAVFELPLELRNKVARLEITGEQSAGAVVLADERWRRRSVGIVSGASAEEAQPLLSDAYYLRRAIGPYAELRDTPASRDAQEEIRALLSSPLSVLILSDIGNLPDAEHDLLDQWVRQGGLLVRFAGPRLAEKSDSLVPVPLRSGGRALGGSLSWSTPQHLAPFEEGSPFFGLTIPGDVTVSRQVLAEPVPDLSNRTWARLSDGTPLVTAGKRGDGLVVLFHVPANRDWSNLPISGLFVEMLRRTIELSQAVTGMDGEDGNESSRKGDLLSPLATLDGFGRLGTPPATATAISVEQFESAERNPRHPPGLYGTAGNPRALNLATPGLELTPVGALSGLAERRTFQGRAEERLAPPAFLLALVLLVLDTVAALWVTGLFETERIKRVRFASRFTPVLIAALLALPSPDAQAQDASGDSFALKASLDTRLAYVLTGNAAIDMTSEAGLSSLSRILAARTAFEPAEPMGVNLATDELAFFPLLYWPMTAEQEDLTPETLGKLNTYMKNGGTIFFDTRDQDQAVGGMVTPGTATLRRLLGRLDLPPLAPVPAGHVLTKSFYLLRDFPGRWSGGELWVEAPSPDGENLSNDGVSTIIVGSNDYAAAWARDAQGRALYAVSPGGERQREMAERFGVNLVMYALTGNYKADQVHVPALLERLGQ
jgi:hypothetical protein